MFGNKGQVATEYILLTGFILIIVTLIFTYSFVTNTQNIKISQANTAIDKLANAADLVYALGPDNVKIVQVVFPKDIITLEDLAVCVNGDQDYDIDCSAKGGIRVGAIEMQVSMLGTSTNIRRPIKSEIEIDFPVGESIPITAGVHRVKVYWCDSNIERICLKRA